MLATVLPNNLIFYLQPPQFMPPNYQATPWTSLGSIYFLLHQPSAGGDAKEE